jgi:hypothetical protein
MSETLTGVPSYHRHEILHITKAFIIIYHVASTTIYSGWLFSLHVATSASTIASSGVSGFTLQTKH